ncbi:hypothetical protein PsorP6_000296 [Peronosclerospora sorghi]|uniref:Uncharacterized protein n=1 Tax=Peronosclerospora sorghi TaxID=230839 RepID=A0ACC0WZG7_9STRA|nr:hypothetical protein PsorP6_000296 [Peronosclerospora sorghi]
MVAGIQGEVAKMPKLGKNGEAFPIKKREILTVGIYKCKTLKSQSGAQQFTSPTQSSMGMPQHQQGAAIVTQASHFSRPSMRPMAAPYAVDTSCSSVRNPMANIGRPETPRMVRRPSVGMFDRFARPQIEKIKFVRVHFHTGYGYRKFNTSFRPATGRNETSYSAPENSAATPAASWISFQKVLARHSVSSIKQRLTI